MLPFLECCGVSALEWGGCAMLLGICVFVFRPILWTVHGTCISAKVSVWNLSPSLLLAWVQKDGAYAACLSVGDADMFQGGHLWIEMWPLCQTLEELMNMSEFANIFCFRIYEALRNLWYTRVQIKVQDYILTSFPKQGCVRIWACQQLCGRFLWVLRFVKLLGNFTTVDKLLFFIIPWWRLSMRGCRV